MNPTHFPEALRDVALAEPTLREALFTGGAIGAWIEERGPEGRSWTSPGLWRTLGRDPALADGSASLRSLVHPDDADALIAARAGAGERWSAAVRFRHASGAPVWVRVEGWTAPGAGPGYHLGVVRVELSGTGPHPGSLPLARFAQRLDHELRAPVRGMRHCLSWIREELPLPSAEVTANLDAIERRIGWIEARSVGMRSYFDAHHPGDRERIDTNRLVDEVIAEQSWPDAIAREGELPAVDYPPERLRQVLRALLDNALRHGAPPVTVGHDPIEEGTRLWVTDRGPGIPAASVEAVFEPYRSMRSVEEVETVGMGLTVCRVIVETHGGSIGIDPAPDGGTTVWFVVPSREAA